MFPLSPTEQKELDTFLRENLANGRIRLSKSLIGAPVFFIKKKEGSLHLVQDYQKLNEIMVKNSYLLPLVSNMLTRLHDVEWFTTLDLCWGFNNVQLKEGDEWKAAFSMNQGLFELLIMFFGLCNSPATFQTMMNDILCPLSIAMKPFATWTTSSSTPPPLQTIGGSLERYSRPSIPTSCSSDQRNANSNVERWTTLGSSSPKTV